MRGRPRRNVIPYDKTDSVIHDYVERGTTIREIAKQYDVTTYQVRQLLKAAEVKIRARGRKQYPACSENGILGYSNPEIINLSSPLGEIE